MIFEEINFIGSKKFDSIEDDKHCIKKMINELTKNIDTITTYRKCL